MKIREYFERIEAGETVKAIAESINKPPKAINRALQRANFEYNRTTKAWEYKGEGEPPLDEEFVFLASGQRLSAAIKKTPNQKEIQPENQTENNTTSKEVKKKENKHKNNMESQTDRNPESVVKKVTYEIRKSLHDQLRIKAIVEERTVSEMVDQAISDFLKKEAQN